ncbi:MAG: DUF6165 family protein [Microcoleaceae cyanobacterium]
MIIQVPISLGELVDKITILELKLEYIQDKDKLSNVQKEYKLLTDVLENSMETSKIENLKVELKEINRKLWFIEDDIRDCERSKDFGENFITLARSVYFTNDKRAKIKKDINLQVGSDIVEEKSYASY